MRSGVTKVCENRKSASSSGGACRCWKILGASNDNNYNHTQVLKSGKEHILHVKIFPPGHR